MDERMGLPQRMIGVIFFPGRVFQSLHAHPTFIAPMLIVAILSAAVIPLLMPLNVQLVEQQLQKNPNLSQEQREQAKAMSQGRLAIGMGMASALIMTPIIFLVYAVLFQTIFNFVLGGHSTFKPVLSIVVHASLVSVLGLIVTVPLMLYQGQPGITLNAGTLFPFLDEEGFVYRVIKNIDLFTIWWLCLLSIGLGSLYRMATARTASVLFSLWALWILIKVTLTPILSSYIPGL